MVKQHLEVFARVKPYDDKIQTLNSFCISEKCIGMEVPRNKLSNAKDHHEFGFNKIFEGQCSQQDIFCEVAQPVIDNCLEGYNGTIFAYGQTGSGKTFTMSGGDHWSERGIIPRVLTYIFEQFQKRSKRLTYQMQVSFIEIYNESAYDLLDENHTENNFEEWTKIIFMEDQSNTLQMKNVTNHHVSNKQQALDKLMMGNYIRKINSTSLNQTSSRSHCIFTLNICGKNVNTFDELYSKIHLVDLAGSERVSKSQAEGIVLTQAKSINLSLTYLEQVIVSLNQKIKTKAKQHIPYRNSLLTTLLKDSLGGNCKTVMIATISLEKSNIEETISTLRFSQRVRQIQNQISKNQSHTFSNKIELLEKQNSMLKKKLALFEQQQKYNEDQFENEEEISQKVQKFMNYKDEVLEVESIQRSQVYFMKMKQIYNKRMNEYVSELTFISEKLIKYDEILTKKENRRKNHC